MSTRQHSTITRISSIILVACTCIACNSLEIDKNEISRIVDADFSTFEISQSNNQAVSNSEIPTFPVDLCIDESNYKITVTNSESSTVDQWIQDISSGFSYETVGEVTFRVEKEVDYTLPIEKYSLSGNETALQSDTSVDIPLYNEHFAAISIYSPNIKSVTINEVTELPTVTSGDDQFIYSFIDPSISYTITITDVYDNVYTSSLNAVNIEVNDLFIYYLQDRNLDGNFELIYDWQTIDQTFNLDPFYLSYGIRTVLVDDITKWTNTNGKLYTQAIGSKASVFLTKDFGYTYADLFEKQTQSTTIQSEFSKFYYSGDTDCRLWNVFDTSSSNTMSTVSIYIIEQNNGAYSRRQFLGRGTSQNDITNIHTALEWYFWDTESESYLPVYDYDGNLAQEITEKTIQGMTVENNEPNGSSFTFSVFFNWDNYFNS